MDPYIALTLLVAALLWFVAGLVRAFFRVWMDHRIRVAGLERAAASNTPESIDIAPSHATPRAQHQDYRLTGALLALAGLAAIAIGTYLGHGQTAVGVYIGGFVCVAFGVLIALAGMVLKSLAVMPRPVDSGSDAA